MIFLPSLKHLAAVRVALSVYNDDILLLFEALQPLYAVDKLGKFFYKNKNMERWIRKVKKKARKKFSGLLPKLLQDLITCILQPLVDEIYFWLRDHNRFIKHIEKIHCTNSLCWKMQGTIDRTKTAINLMENEDIDKRVRFVMACTYSQKDYVVYLWHSMKPIERENSYLIDYNITVQLWKRWLRADDQYPWTQCITDCLGSDFDREIDFYMYGGRIRLSSFFMKLDIVKQTFFLCRFWPESAHFDDLRLCYCLADEAEREEIFHSNFKTRDLLCCYLDWPFQSLFFDVVNQVSSYLSASCFEYVLCYILEEKLMWGMQDVDYLELLKDFWNLIPDEYQEEIRSSDIFLLIHAAMTYDKNTHPLPIDKFLNKCREYLPPPRVLILILNQND